MMLEYRNITKKFGNKEAVKELTLNLKKGTIYGLLGENGSGKTTLMNMLSGIYFPDEGQIFINGKEEVINPPRMRYGWESVWCISILS